MKFKINHFFALLVCFFIFVESESRNKNKVSKRKYSNYLNRFRRDWPLQLKSTNANDWGNSATIFLDRHEVNCDIGAVTSFRLTRPKPDQISYNYKCIYPQNCKADCETAIKKLDTQKCIVKSTPVNDIGNEYGKSTNYLDRHYVKCDTGFVLTKFKFGRMPPKIKYDYTCCPAKVEACSSFNTGITDFGDYGSIYLDRQDLKAPDEKNQAITGFKLNTDYGKHGYSYTIDFCKVTG